MKKKIVVISTIVAILIVLGSLSPSVCSKDIEPVQTAQSGDTVTVEVNRYYGKQSESIFTELSYEEAEQIKEILIQLNEAIENNDEETIKECESILNQKGIFGDEYEEFYSHDTFSKKMDSSGLSRYSRYFKQNGDNISNLMCYFHATGEGMMFFTLGIRILEAIFRAMQNASSLIEALIILFALLPFYVLVAIMTHLIPFRILMPLGIVRMDNGTITSLGLKGLKRVTTQDEESIMVNISWFTGLTINLPISGLNFLFVSGIALRVEESGL